MVASKWGYVPAGEIDFDTPDATMGELAHSTQFVYKEAVQFYPTEEGSTYFDYPVVEYGSDIDYPTIDNGGMDVYVTSTSETLPLGSKTIWKRGKDGQPGMRSTTFGNTEYTAPDNEWPECHKWFTVAHVAPHLSGLAVGDVIDVTAVPYEQEMESLADAIDMLTGRDTPDAPGLTIFTA
ncbi:MAG TPA: hypothetical protein VF572_01845 [Candidatus Saccharimonadales bacterium]